MWWRSAGTARGEPPPAPPSALPPPPPPPPALLPRASTSLEFLLNVLLFSRCSGRKITAKGQKDLDLIATTISPPVA